VRQRIGLITIIRLWINWKKIKAGKHWLTKFFEIIMRLNHVRLFLVTLSLLPLNLAGGEHKMDIAPVAVRLGDSLATVFRDNPLDKTPFRTSNTRDGFMLPLEAKASDTDGLQGYELHYADGDCSIKLPPGRILHFSHYAGFVHGIFYVFPLEKLNYTEAVALVNQIVQQIDSAGFQRQKFQAPPGTGGLPEGWDHFPVAKWRGCKLPGTQLTLDIQDIKLSPSGSAVVPWWFNPPIEKEDTLNQYVLRLSADHFEMRRETSELRNARREALHGNRKKYVPLSVWLDDPNWRPQGWDGQYIRGHKAQ
jgi:hypothetical protein